MRLRAVGIAAVSALGLAAASRANTYYVAPPGSGGNDGNNGGPGSPWATLQHAADTVGPGDTVFVRAGDFAAFQMENSGTQAQPITFENYPGETVNIVTDYPGRGAGINLEGASYITLEGFHIANRSVVGIRAVLCAGVTIRGNVLDANGTWGILTGCCDDLLIEGNVTTNSGSQHGIYVGNSGDRPVLRGNLSFGNAGSGIHMNGDITVDCSPFLTTDGIISNAVVEGNTLFDNGGGSAINCDGVQDSLIRNNLVWAEHASGISLFQQDGGGPSNGNRVENNSILVASDGRWALNIQDGSAGTTVENNVLWSDQSYRGAMDVCSPDCLVNFTSDYNAVESDFTLDDGGSTLTLAQWRSATGQDQHSFAIADLAALFVDSADGNYHLATGSPAVDAGTTIGDLAHDLDWTPRPQGAAYDVGAFEGTNAIFIDRFESGATNRWSATVP